MLHFPTLRMSHFLKHFSIEGARELLPKLRLLFQQLHGARDQLQEDDFNLAQQLIETGGDLGGAQVISLGRALGDLHSTLGEIQKLGVQIKEIDRGLLDFPHLRDGKEVFLCWELSERNIEYWHELDTGYVGREKI